MHKKLSITFLCLILAQASSMFGMEDKDFIDSKLPKQAVPFGAVALSDDEDDEIDDKKPTAPPAKAPKKTITAPVLKKASPPPKSITKKTVAPKVPQKTIAVQAPKRVAPPNTVAKKMVAPKPDKEETVEVQIALPKSFFETLTSSIGSAAKKTTRAINKRVNPYDYVIDEKNAVLYSYLLEKIEVATCVKDLQPLLTDAQYGDALKALFDRSAYATDLERSTISEIIRRGKMDGNELEKLSEITEAAESAQEACSAVTFKILSFFIEKAERTVDIAQRSANRLPRSQTLPPLEQEEEGGDDDIL